MTDIATVETQNFASLLILNLNGLLPKSTYKKFQN